MTVGQKGGPLTAWQGKKGACTFVDGRRPPMGCAAVGDFHEYGSRAGIWPSGVTGFVYPVN